jgi:hypothetical protein
MYCSRDKRWTSPGPIKELSDSDNLSRDDCRAAFRLSVLFFAVISRFLSLSFDQGRNLAEVLIYFADADLLADRRSIAGSLARFVLCTSAGHFD